MQCYAVAQRSVSPSIFQFVHSILLLFYIHCLSSLIEYLQVYYPEFQLFPVYFIVLQCIPVFPGLFKSLLYQVYSLSVPSGFIPIYYISPNYIWDYSSQILKSSLIMYYIYTIFQSLIFSSSSIVKYIPCYSSLSKSITVFHNMLQSISIYLTLYKFSERFSKVSKSITINFSLFLSCQL